MKIRGITKSFGFYVGDHTRPSVERLVDPSGKLTDEIWSIPIDAAAIRDAGIRCETCKHWKNGDCIGPPCDLFSGGEYSGDTPADFFCAHWSGFGDE